MGSVKLAVDESKRSVKPMSRQLIEGNSYGSDIVINRKRSHARYGTADGDGGKSRVENEPYSAS
jgi:hypothetical protein